MLGTKREIKAHREEIGWDEPTFLWYLFKYYHSIAEQTVQTTLAKLNNLPTMIENQCKENIERFATYVMKLFLRFAENEGSDVQAFTRSTKC